MRGMWGHSSHEWPTPYKMTQETQFPHKMTRCNKGTGCSQTLECATAYQFNLECFPLESSLTVSISLRAQYSRLRPRWGHPSNQVALWLGSISTNAREHAIEVVWNTMQGVAVSGLKARAPYIGESESDIPERGCIKCHQTSHKHSAKTSTWSNDWKTIT